jgi:hypothetical protein
MKLTIKKAKKFGITKYFIFRGKSIVGGPFNSKESAQRILNDEKAKAGLSNPSIISSNDTDWVPCHAIRRCANGDIQILTEKGTLSNPGKKKKILGKLKGLFSAGAKAVGLRNPGDKIYVITVNGNREYETNSKSAATKKFNLYKRLAISGDWIQMYKNNFVIRTLHSRGEG